MYCLAKLCTNYTEGDTDYCASHNFQRRKAERLALKPEKKKKAIPKFSKKRKDENVIYSERRILFLEGKRCVVYPDWPATTVHHAKGRYGYADNWARDNKIPLLLDERFWIPASALGHSYIELHPQEAKERGWSLSRLENLDQEPEII